MRSAPTRRWLLESWPGRGDAAGDLLDRGAVSRGRAVGASRPVRRRLRFTGASAAFTVPPGVTTLTVTALGAQGGAGAAGTSPGGLGGSVTATLTVAPGETLNVFVGGQGGTGLRFRPVVPAASMAAGQAAQAFSAAAEAARPTSARAVAHCQIVWLSQGAVVAAPQSQRRRRRRGHNWCHWLRQPLPVCRERRWRWHSVVRWIGRGKPHEQSQQRSARGFRHRRRGRTRHSGRGSRRRRRWRLLRRRRRRRRLRESGLRGWWWWIVVGCARGRAHAR